MSMINKINFILAGTTVVFATVAYGAVHQPVIALVYLLVSTMTVLWAAGCLKENRIRIDGNYFQLILLSAAIYGAVQVFPFGHLPATGGVDGIPWTISLDPFATQVNALHFLALLLYFAVTITLLDSASRIRKAAILIGVFGFSYSFFAVIQSVLSPEKIYGIYGRYGAHPFGSFVSRNNFAAWVELAISIPLGLLFVGAVKKDKKLLFITAMAIMGASLLLSGSRGGLVAFLAELLFLLFITIAQGDGRRKIARIGLLAGILAAVAGGAYFVGGETSLSRLSGNEGAVGSDVSRTHIWAVTLKVIGETMPLGAGLGGFGAAYTKFDQNSGLARVEQAHNDYLQVVSDAGIIGVILGVSFLFLFFRTGFRSIRTDDLYRRGIASGAFAGMFAVMVHSLFDFPLHTTAIALLFLLTLTLLIVSGRSYNDDVPKEQNPRAHYGI